MIGGKSGVRIGIVDAVTPMPIPAELISNPPGDELLGRFVLQLGRSVMLDGSHLRLGKHDDLYIHDAGLSV
jgi:hypothetical protein